ncbi:phosphatase PAP2 family protein [Atrimonas thermophila]|uniref:phosphatase PAP2 family protein n=1 Tax=Atrimonas thermophila TaxID=3064161 RepID=UPI00399CCF89
MFDVTPLLFLQGLRNPFWNSFFRGVSVVGSDLFYLVVLVIWYLAFSKREGIYLSLVLFASLFLNFAVKSLVAVPRPYLHPMLQAISEAEGFSFPSGHAQSTATFFFSLALLYKKRPVWVLAFLMVGLVSFSRLYLGVHYVEDVLAGALLGAGFAFAAFYLKGKLEGNEVNIVFWWKVAVAAGVALSLFWFCWDDLSARVGGAISGALLGWFLEGNAENLAWKSLFDRIVFLGLALLSVLACFLVLRGVFPEGREFLFLRYAIVVFWVVFGIPVLTRHLRRKLAGGS